MMHVCEFKDASPRCDGNGYIFARDPRGWGHWVCPLHKKQLRAFLIAEDDNRVVAGIEGAEPARESSSRLDTPDDTKVEPATTLLEAMEVINTHKQLEGE